MLATGKLADLLLQLRLVPSSMRASEENTHLVQAGVLTGVIPAGRIHSRMLDESQQGLNLRRVRVVQGGVEVATFLIAVAGHAGAKGRSGTGGDIEVPAQLMRDLFDGTTHMAELTLDLDNM